MVDGECKFTESHLAYQGNESAQPSGARYKTERTDILRRILDLREQGRDLGHIECFHVEHGMVSAIIHGVEDDLKVDNFSGRGQLRLHYRRNKDCVICVLVEFQWDRREVREAIR